MMREEEPDAVVEALEDLVNEASYPCSCASSWATNGNTWLRSRWKHTKDCPIKKAVDTYRAALTASRAPGGKV